MQSQAPFNHKEVYRLTNLGLSPELFKFGSITFESSKYICVKDQQDCAIIDTTKNFALERKNMKAEGILMHRTKNVIALRAPQNNTTTIQVFDLDSKSKVKQCVVNEQVRFWRWIDEDTLGIVGKTDVYHTSINDSNAPQKIFTLDAKFANAQIMNYGIDSTKKWVFVNGIYPGANNQICGHMQLFNLEKRQDQKLDGGFCAAFTDMPVSDAVTHKNSLFCFAQRKVGENTTKLHIMEIGNPAPGAQKLKQQADIQMQDGDFPVLMHDSTKYGCLFIVTKMGFVYMYEVSTASLLFRQQLTDQLCFVATRNPNTDGMLIINKAGQIFMLNVDENVLVQYVANSAHIPNNKDLSFKLAQRFSLPGADEMFQFMFNSKFAAGDYAGAAQAAMNAPGTLLRNTDTINKFKALPQNPGAPAPILIYFNTLLQSTKLNETESVELAKPVIAQNKLQLLEGWIKEQKLTMSNELGDLIRAANPQMALNIYQQSGSPDKVIQGLIETGQLDKIMPYCQQQNYNPDFVAILRQIMPVNPQAAVNLAKMVTNRDQGPPKANIDQVTQTFLEFNRIQECTAFLLEALKTNRPDEGHLQTKVFEINLMSAPNVAEGIFKLNIFSQYDRERVAKMCESVGLYGRALQNYSSMSDIKRVILNTHAIPEDQIIQFFGRLGEEDCLQCMYDMLKSSRQNVNIVAKIAVQYADKINTNKAVEVLESFGSNEGMLFYLANVLPKTDDPEIYFKYIQACARLQNYREVERVIRETQNYDPVKVKEFLMETKLLDPRPLIYLCDIHGYVEELTRHLFSHNQNIFIETYVFKVNVKATPKVLGTLLEMDCDEVYIQKLLNSSRMCPIPELVEEFQERGKLRLLQSWLEMRADERLQDPALHNALAMIYIDINKDPQTFLTNNQFYDAKVVGKYCEDRDPDLAFIAYKSAWGECDDEIIAVTNKSYMFRSQASYLVERKDEPLWAKVLNPENPHRREIIDQVVQFVLPQTKDAEEVQVTVRAFMTAELPQELIELLERIVLHNSDFSSNDQLQNLLILTAIKSDRSRVMDYITRLDNYDAVGLAQEAEKDEYQLYDEAFTMYKKKDEFVKAITILLHKQNNMKGASEFAEKINKPDVWTELGKAQLDQSMLCEAIESFIKAENPQAYMAVIHQAQVQQTWEELVTFLTMARKTLKEQMIDNELIFAYAQCGEKYLGQIEYFISEPNQAKLNDVADKCFKAKLYAATKILYTKTANHHKMAEVYVMTKEYVNAYDAAKKADIPKVWKAVCFACVRAKEFKTALECGLKVIILPDHLDDLIQFYEKFGYYNELVTLLEQGMRHERKHNGIFTELGILFSKHMPNKLMDLIRTYPKNLHIPKLIRACEQQLCWSEAVQLHQLYEQDNFAIQVMIEHSPTAFDHNVFAQSIMRVSNQDLLYRAIIFYLEEQPEQLNDLLNLISSKLDLAKTVQVMKRTNYIALIEPFLKQVQVQNVAAVNEALNEIYLSKQDYQSLTASIKNYESFESLQLAQEMENHELLECRKISALLYRKNKKYKKSIEVSQKDKDYKSAMETVAESQDKQLAEELLRYVMDMEDKALVAAMLYTCYELIRPEVALEIAWRSNIMEFVMPYFIQFVKDTSSRVDTVQKKTEDIKRKEEKKAKEQMDKPLDVNMDMMFAGQMGGAPQVAAIMPAPGMMPPMGGAGMGPPMGGMGVPPMGPPGGMAPPGGMGQPGFGQPPNNNPFGGM